MWGVWGPLIGAAFAIAFAGEAVTNMPGALDWLIGDLPEKAGVPSWVLFATGALGFVSLTAKAAVIESLTAWVLTDKRLVRVVRYAPFLTRAWPRADVKMDRVKLRNAGAQLRLKVPHRWWGTQTISLRARQHAGVLVDALERERAGRP